MRECWINIYKDMSTGKIHRGFMDWDSKHKAVVNASDVNPPIYRIHVKLK